VAKEGGDTAFKRLSKTLAGAWGEALLAGSLDQKRLTDPWGRGGGLRRSIELPQKLGSAGL